ncbi:MAG TPA: hypothetical protein VHT03_07080 [Rhizomicrobium sp.]|jgi:hypothetical protein|nr:hypothetical protein [Rhizomicrobium sp.]
MGELNSEARFGLFVPFSFAAVMIYYFVLRSFTASITTGPLLELQMIRETLLYGVPLVISAVIGAMLHLWFKEVPRRYRICGAILRGDSVCRVAFAVHTAVFLHIVRHIELPLIASRMVACRLTIWINGTLAV